MAERPGLIVLFGSGEIAPSGRKVYERVFSRLTPPVRVAVLETPAGFQPNSAAVAGKIAEFLQGRLQNYRPEVRVLPARRRGSALSPDDPEILSPMLDANVIFMGPGSPSYAVRQLEGSLAWRYLQARSLAGVAVILASAATIAAGSYALPVYEIYKVGEDLHWRRGLDLFGPYGLPVTFIPHWDNHEGGTELDTSRCFMGQERFGRLLELLPGEMPVVGIDEHTALIVDLAAGSCQVMGRGGVTVLREGCAERHGSGATFPLDRIGQYRIPAGGESVPGLPPTQDAPTADARSEEAEPPAELLELVQSREDARARREWAEADALRLRVEQRGWRIRDTRDGPRLEPSI
jgi:hypothetical protein